MRVRLAAFLVCVLATRVYADAASDLFAEGTKLLDAGDAAGACAKFAQVLEARPSAPGVLLNLGLCNERLNKLATALKWFREAQLRASERQQSETEAAAKAKTTFLAPLVPTIKIQPSAPLPAGALVLLDGATIERTKFARVEVDAGPHTIVVSGAGLDGSDQKIDVPPRTTDPMLVPLTVKPVERKEEVVVPVEPKKEAPLVDHPIHPRTGHRGIAIGLAATGVAALAVGGFFLWDASYLGDQRDKLGCSLGNPCSGMALADYDDRGHRANTIATVGFIAGGVALAVSTMMFTLSW